MDPLHERFVNVPRVLSSRASILTDGMRVTRGSRPHDDGTELDESSTLSTWLE